MISKYGSNFSMISTGSLLYSSFSILAIVGLEIPDSFAKASKVSFLVALAFLILLPGVFAPYVSIIADPPQ